MCIKRQAWCPGRRSGTDTKPPKGESSRRGAPDIPVLPTTVWRGTVPRQSSACLPRRSGKHAASVDRTCSANCSFRRPSDGQAGNPALGRFLPSWPGMRPVSGLAGPCPCAKTWVTAFGPFGGRRVAVSPVTIPAGGTAAQPQTTLARKHGKGRNCQARQGEGPVSARTCRRPHRNVTRVGYRLAYEPEARRIREPEREVKENPVAGNLTGNAWPKVV